jgi:hypothetical protein
MQSTEHKHRSVASYSKSSQEDVIQSVDDAISHFEATGLHITLDEFIGWTQTVKFDRDARPPSCHT